MIIYYVARIMGTYTLDSVCKGPLVDMYL